MTTTLLALADITKLDVSHQKKAVTLKVFALLDPASYSSAIALTRTHKLELGKP